MHPIVVWPLAWFEHVRASVGDRVGVAALGAHHWQVAKSVQDGVTLSRVTPLGEVERVDEIARMISGDTVTDEARAAARSLLG